MRNLSMRILTAAAFLILAVPFMGSAQSYNRYYERNNDRYDRSDRRDVRDAINRLDNASAQLENDLRTGRQRRVLGFLYVNTVDSNAVTEVRDFRRAVRDLRRSSRGDYAGSSRDEAQAVIDQGMRLDRYLRVRTGSTNVDADLAEIRSNLHVIADAYNLGVTY